jgi:hypothetical protein
MLRQPAILGGCLPVSAAPRRGHNYALKRCRGSFICMKSASSPSNTGAGSYLIRSKKVATETKNPHPADFSKAKLCTLLLVYRTTIAVNGHT